MRYALVVGAAVFLLSACSSTYSALTPELVSNETKIAIVPFNGEYGPQTVDLISQEFAKIGISTVQGSRVVQHFTAIDTTLNDGDPETVKARKQYGEDLGVDFVLTGQVEGIEKLPYGFSRIKMTMKLIDINSGQTRWVGDYGNSLWTSATNTQADMSRGARHIVKAFDESGASDLVR